MKPAVTHIKVIYAESFNNPLYLVRCKTSSRVVLHHLIDKAVFSFDFFCTPVTFNWTVYSKPLVSYPNRVICNNRRT